MGKNELGASGRGRARPKGGGGAWCCDVGLALLQVLNRLDVADVRHLFRLFCPVFKQQQPSETRWAQRGHSAAAGKEAGEAAPDDVRLHQNLVVSGRNDRLLGTGMAVCCLLQSLLLLLLACQAMGARLRSHGRSRSRCCRPYPRRQGHPKRCVTSVSYGRPMGGGRHTSVGRPLVSKSDTKRDRPVGQ